MSNLEVTQILILYSSNRQKRSSGHHDTLVGFFIVSLYLFIGNRRQKFLPIELFTFHLSTPNHDILVKNIIK